MNPKVLEQLHTYLLQNKHFFLVAIDTKEQIEAWRQGQRHFDIDQKQLVPADQAARSRQMEQNGFPTLLSWQDWRALDELYLTGMDVGGDEEDRIPEVIPLEGGMAAAVHNGLQDGDDSEWDKRYGSLDVLHKLLEEMDDGEWD